LIHEVWSFSKETKASEGGEDDQCSRKFSHIHPDWTQLHRHTGCIRYHVKFLLLPILAQPLSRLSLHKF
jgi:hypothetical protein